MQIFFIKKKKTREIKHLNQFQEIFEIQKMEIYSEKIIFLTFHLTSFWPGLVFQ